MFSAWFFSACDLAKPESCIGAVERSTLMDVAETVLSSAMGLHGRGDAGVVHIGPHGLLVARATEQPVETMVAPARAGKGSAH